MYRTLGECRGNANATASAVVQREVSWSSSPDSECHRKAGSTDARIGVNYVWPGCNSRKATISTHDAGRRKSPSDVRKESHLELVAGRHLGVIHYLVLTILHDDGLYPYCYSAIHNLMGDRPRRLEYCHRMLTSLQHDPDFVGHILWTDEAQFTRKGIFNCHNSGIMEHKHVRFLKEIVYCEPVDSIEECIARLHAAVVHATKYNLHVVQEATSRRVRACIEIEGGQLEHLML
ncbi:hypothetical protein PR048_000616 [Dryococelus australis]|uniref:Uncharacterized protein n=1 Tax=Dryococelus australis TaxID=614101 RepID=A0ABQ9IF97_9NEOP|nr:hypothetical protein PR048_000616 [Dryococelus australis]